MSKYVHEKVFSEFVFSHFQSRQMAKPGLKIWLSAFRLRTLPLGVASILAGSFTAALYGEFQLLIAILALLTTFFLQILSNLANDYGDAKSGADNENRIGPIRTVQSGQIAPQQMKKAVIIFIILSLFCGTALIVAGTVDKVFSTSVIFFILGIAAIAASIKYTIGKKPYGYRGFGDIFVFLFFGLAGVMGTFYLHAGFLKTEILLPAVTLGLFSTAALNINNMRDRENDKRTGKMTFVVKIGSSSAKVYHFFLITGGWLAMLLFAQIKAFPPTGYAFLLVLPMSVTHLIQTFRREPGMLDPQLKLQSLSTLLFVLLYGISVWQM